MTTLTLTLKQGPKPSDWRLLIEIDMRVKLEIVLVKHFAPNHEDAAIFFLSLKLLALLLITLYQLTKFEAPSYTNFRNILSFQWPNLQKVITQKKKKLENFTRQSSHYSLSADQVCLAIIVFEISRYLDYQLSFWPFRGGIKGDKLFLDEESIFEISNSNLKVFLTGHTHRHTHPCTEKLNRICSHFFKFGRIKKS